MAMGYILPKDIVVFTNLMADQNNKPRKRDRFMNRVDKVASKMGFNHTHSESQTASWPPDNTSAPTGSMGYPGMSMPEPDYSQVYQSYQNNYYPPPHAAAWPNNAYQNDAGNGGQVPKAPPISSSKGNSAPSNSNRINKPSTQGNNQGKSSDGKKVEDNKAGKKKDSKKS